MSSQCLVVEALEAESRLIAYLIQIYFAFKSGKERNVFPLLNACQALEGAFLFFSLPSRCSMPPASYCF